MAKLWTPTYKNPIVLDIETYDPNLLEKGNGVYRKDGWILGCGVYDPETGFKDYFPLCAGNGISEQEAKAYVEELRPILENDRDKLLANACYDLDWLENFQGLKVNGFIHDVQLAEPLLNQYRPSFSLQALSEYYGVQGKQTTDIEAWADKIDPKRQTMKKTPPAQKYLWLMPAQVVGEYCVGDLDATYAVWEKQMVELDHQNLKRLYEVECNLIRPRLIMRKYGIRIDQVRRLEAIDKVRGEEEQLFDLLHTKYGVNNINSSQQLAPILLREGIPLEKTPKGADSVSKETLEQFEKDNELCRVLLRCRKLNKLRTTFLEKSIDEHICPDGRIHGDFHPLRKDDAGTITGRWSGANPNLQQIPRNDKELGALVRGIFLPEEGCWYGHTDYGQIEYRVFAHYARGWRDGDELDQQAKKMRADYNAKPMMDYHQYVMDLIEEIAHTKLDRPTVKRVNFGTLYFMGAKSLSRKFHMDYDDAVHVQDALFTALPFIESTRSRVVRSAQIKGYVKTWGGRIQRVGPQHIDQDKYYPLFNYLIQGTAADIMKVSLVECYRAGVYEVLPLHLLVHDETGTSIAKTLEAIEAYAEQKHIMETALPLSVPIIADADYGLNWGEQSEGIDAFEAMRKEIANG